MKKKNRSLLEAEIAVHRRSRLDAPQARRTIWNIMVFSSLSFLFLFLPIVLGGYLVVPRAARNTWLLIMSLLFYTWGEQWYALAMIGTILFNFGMGRILDRLRGTPQLAGALVFAVCGNLATLIFFKYASFIVDNLNWLLGIGGLHGIDLPPIHLPIGISFFTFQAISYVVDVSRGDISAQRNLVDYGMYKSFFPQLIAGPIVRYKDVAGEVDSRQTTYAGVSAGASRFIMGLGKKVLIANTLAEPVDQLFAAPPTGLTAGMAWLGATCYLLQLYFDFSGYSDMAIGLAKMFGFHFRENFDYPYVAESLRDFWKRWHISLSAWFRDYLYIPLGGNRHGRWRTAMNLLTVFVLCGLWHGANWTFLAWGLYHGAFLAIEHLGFDRALRASWRPLRHAYLWSALLFGTVLFRAETVGQGCAWWRSMVGLGDRQDGVPWSAIADNKVVVTLVLAVLLSVRCGPRATEWIASHQPTVLGSPIYQSARLVCLATVMGLAILSLATSTINPFIYFRF